MARVIPAAALAKLNTQYGTEPVVIVEIQWVEGGQRCAYADRDIAGGVRGQIVDLGTIDSTVQTDGTTDSTQVSLTLDDTDGAIKGIYDSLDLHKRPVWVYQWFEGLALADKFLLFKGEINTPVAWNEGDRTIALDVTTRVEDVEAGFAMEEGDFPLIPEDALGKAWPLVFGSACDVKAVQVRAPRRGTLQSGEGIHDYTLESRICQARFIQCPNVPLGEYDVVTPTTPITVESEGTVVFSATTYQAEGPEQSCVESRFFTICDLMHQLEQQWAYEHPTMTVVDGARLFPQNERVVLNINGGKFLGTFSGDVFTIASREHPDYELNPPSVCVPIEDRTYTIDGVLDQTNWEKAASGTAWYDASCVAGSSGGTDISPQDISTFCDTEVQTESGYTVSGGPVTSQKTYDDMATSSFFWARAGSSVYLEAESEVLYIVSLLPCTITRVAAMKTTNSVAKLTTVPPEYYTIYETDYDGYTVAEIGMEKLLSTRTTIIEELDGVKHTIASGWDDDIYVTVVSSVGPNPVDIISWLIGKYTSLTVDATSFAHVHTRLANYPCNFALTGRKNVLQLITDVATQSRCIFYARDGVAYLKYASEEPASLVTLTESDVLANSLVLGLTETEDIATKHTVTWSRSQEEGDLKLLLKYNVAKYGTHEKLHDYYTQNIFDNVLKSATFWMIRDANVWKTVEFKTPLKHLGLEVFDCITLDLDALATPSPVKATVKSVQYDVANQQIMLTCWTPLRAGEIAPYIHAWPADLPVGTVFPTAEETAAGLGYTFTVAPPVDHLLYTEPEDTGQPTLVLSSGDPSPSDLDDTLSTCFCPTAADAVIDEQDPVFDALKRAQLAAQEAEQAEMDESSNVSANLDSDQKEKKKGACGKAPSSGCRYEVKVQYLQSATAVTCAGPCNCDKLGGPCMGQGWATMCHTFGAMFSANAFYNQIKGWMEANKCSWYCGMSGPYIVSKPAARAAQDAECEDAPGDSTKNTGEVTKPALDA